MAKKGKSQGIDAFIYGKLTQASENLEKNQVIYKAKLLVSLIDVESVTTIAMEKGEGERIITSKEEVKGFRKIEEKKEKLDRLISEKDVHLAELKRKYTKYAYGIGNSMWVYTFLLGSVVSFLSEGTYTTNTGEEKTCHKSPGYEIGNSAMIISVAGFIYFWAEKISLENGIKQDRQELNRLKEELNKISFNYNPKNNQIAFNYHLRF